MVQISYSSLVVWISVIWLFARIAKTVKRKRLKWKRELQLLLVYICIVVVVRFTFFPFEKVNGQIQPLFFDAQRMFPLSVNLIPFVNLTNYPSMRDAVLNLVGNTAMFVPLGIVWPSVYKKLNTHKKAIAAGIASSLCIELLQLPFRSRVTDIDDLILNSLGYLIGYGIYVLVKKMRRRLRVRLF